MSGKSKRKAENNSKKYLQKAKKEFLLQWSVLAKQDNKKLELLHVGNIESCVTKDWFMKEFFYEIHEKFAEIRDQKIKRCRRNFNEVERISWIQRSWLQTA